MSTTAHPAHELLKMAGELCHDDDELLAAASVLSDTCVKYDAAADALEAAAEKVKTILLERMGQ